ncbi:Protein fam72a, partial [Mortierella sp. AM989]
MPRSHPSNSPTFGSGTMDHITLENGSFRHRQHVQNHQNIEQQPHRHEPQNILDDSNEMLVDPYLSGLSSPVESSTNTSGRNSVDQSIRGSVSRNGSTDINFSAHFSEFARNTRQDASSERPVIETFIDNEDYQSLLAAVSNIRVSQARPMSEGFMRLGESANQNQSNQQLIHSSLQEGYTGRTLNMQQDEDVCNNNSSSPAGHIYDLQHIMVHNQRQLENQMLRSREEYARQRESSHVQMETRRTPTVVLDSPSSNRTFGIESTTSGGIEGIRMQTSQEPYQNIFDPRPTISSSYFSSTTESTIVLSSPPPGRSSNISPYSANSNVHSNSIDSTPSSHGINRNVTPQRHSSGPYRPFVTGSDLAIQHQQQQEQQVSQISYQQNTTVPRNSSGQISLRFFESEIDNDGGRVVFGENDAGHWSMYGSPAQHTRSFEQQLNQRYGRQQQTDLNISRRHFMGDIAIESQAPQSSYAPPVAPRPNPLLLPLTNESMRRNQLGPSSLPYPGSSIPIPSRYINPQSFNHMGYASPASAPPTSLHFRPPNISTNFSNQGGLRQPISSDPSYRHYETAEQTAGWRGNAAESRTRHNAGLKEVVRMACRFCKAIICERGMKAQLLADQSVALLSTDDAPQSGNAIGYHIAQPCEKCLSSDNNGHLWLFHPEYVFSMPRWDHKFERSLRWCELPEPDQDFESLSLHKVYLGGPDGRLTVGGM